MLIPLFVIKTEALSALKDIDPYMFKLSIFILFSWLFKFLSDFIIYKTVNIKNMKAMIAFDKFNVTLNITAEILGWFYI